MRQWRVAWFVVLALVAGCDDGGDPVAIEWDLTKSHSISDIGQEPDASAGQVESVASALIRLPDGRVFEADEAVHDVIYSQSEGVVEDITVSFDRQTAEGAYERATRLADTWALEPKNLDEWYAEAKGKSGSDAADVDVSGAFADVAGAAPDAGRLGPDGPYVTVHVVYSFDDSEPWIVTFELSWDSPA